MNRIKHIVSLAVILAFLCNIFLLDTGFAQSVTNFNKNSSTLATASGIDDMLGVERQAVREIAIIFEALKRLMFSKGLEINPETLSSLKGFGPVDVWEIDNLGNTILLRHEANMDTETGIVTINARKGNLPCVIEYYTKDCEGREAGQTLVYPEGKRPLPGGKSAFADENVVRDLEAMSRVLQQDVIDMIYKAGSGHPGGSLSMLNMVTALYFSGILRVDPKDPNWNNRDRFVLSKGHAAPGLYAALGRRGYFDTKEFNTLRQLGSILQGHSDMTKTPGVDMSAGSLGVGISAGVGMALAAKMDGRDYTTYVMLGDGESEEGQVSEAAGHAAAMGLDNLIAFLDWNGMQIDGKVTNVDLDYEGQIRLWEARGWNVLRADGDDMMDTLNALLRAKASKNGKPTIIIAKTTKGAGLPGMAAHGSAPKQDDVIAASETIERAIGLLKGPDFDAERHTRSITDKVNLLEKDKAAINRENGERAKTRREDLLKIMQSERSLAARADLEKPYAADKKVSTRTANGDELALIGLDDPDVIAMSADLMGPVMFAKFADLLGTFSSKNALGRYVPAGVREAHMVSMAAGLATCGKIPVIGTFSIFTTRMVDQLNAILNTKLPIIIVGTHGGLATGADGRTHQDAHSLGVLGALPRIRLYEGADAEEERVLAGYVHDTAKNDGLIHYIRPARLDTPILAKPEGWQEGAKKGFYVLYDSDPSKVATGGGYDVVIVSSGVMAVDAIAAAKELAASGQKVRVINVTQLKEINSDRGIKKFASLIGGCAKLISVIDALPETLGNRINEVLVKENIRPVSVRALGIHEFGESGTPAQLYSKHGFDEAGILKTAGEMSHKNETRLSPLHDIQRIGQQIWLDGLTWEMVQNGEFENLVRDHRITGVTTNPTLIKAYLKSDVVRSRIAALAKQGRSRDAIYFEVIKELAQAVIAVFSNCGVNGKFSIELNPNKADDLNASIEEAKMWSGIDPEHIMIKVAATPTGYKIVEELIADGINVNATLIFTNEQYESICNAYITGLERAAKAGKDLKKIYSVASFFVSRWDVKLGAVIPAELQGKLANSISVVAYNEIFKRLFTSHRFLGLMRHGARVQDFLVASTGSKRLKMPELFQDRYPDDIYVKDLMGPYVVNTLPLETIQSIIKKGIETKSTIIDGYDQAKGVMDAMLVRVNFDNTGKELFKEGMTAFIKDFKDVMETIGSIIAAEQGATETMISESPEENIRYAIDAAALAGVHIPITKSDCFNLLVTSEFFKGDELKEHQQKYGNRFNLGVVSGQDADTFIKNVLNNTLAIRDRAIVLLPNELPHGKFKESHYRELTDAGIRFLVVNKRDLIDSEKEERANFQKDTYAVMLLMRALKDGMNKSSPIYRLLSFYLATHFEFTEQMKVGDYIKSITNSDIMTLLKGILAYRPAKAYQIPEYKNVAKTLMSA